MEMIGMHTEISYEFFTNILNVEIFQLENVTFFRVLEEITAENYYIHYTNIENAIIELMVDLGYIRESQTIQSLSSFLWGVHGIIIWHSPLMLDEDILFFGGTGLDYYLFQKTISQIWTLGITTASVSIIISVIILYLRNKKESTKDFQNKSE